MEIPMLSVCCEAKPIPELSDGAGLCSRCRNWTTFEPDEDEIASIKADMDYAAWKDEGKWDDGFQQAP